MKALLQEYKESLRKARKMKEVAPPEDKKIIAGMITDLEFAISWIEKGHMPGPKRGIERRSYYERTIFLDPVLFSRMFAAKSFKSDTYEHDHEEEQEKKIDPMSFMVKCTAREKEIFLMHKVEGFSMQKAADLLGISKSAVQETVSRAKRKIAKQLEASGY